MGRFPMDCLYLSEDVVGRKVLGSRATMWRNLAPVLEREGLPRVNPLMGGRYWPAVRAWLDKHEGLGSRAVPSGADGEETWS